MEEPHSAPMILFICFFVLPLDAGEELIWSLESLQ